jgi:hypothetical protein
MKKYFLFCFLALCAVSFSFAQIYRGEAEIKNGTAAFSLNYVEYTGYQCLLFIDGVSIFLDEDNMARLEAILEKYIEWEEIAEAEQISLTKTIDSITFSSFHYNHTFFKEPLIFYFVFTGGPEKISGAVTSEGGGENTGNSAGPVPTRYTLFVDTTLDRITPFRLGSKTIKEMQLALSPEKLAEARDAYERQKALEELFK